MKSSQVKSFLLIATLLHTLHQGASAPSSIESSENEIGDAGDLIDLTIYGERIFGHPDNDTTGPLVEAYTAESNQNPEELGTYLEGDILIPSTSIHRNGLLAKSSRWAGAIVPYEITGKFSAQELSIINYAFNEYHTRTCIRFRPRTTERDYISINNGKTGCWASVGRLGGRQEVNLQSPSCLRTYGTTIHEFMHVLGFFHELNRHERDSYIKLMPENIKPAMMQNFAKSSSKITYGYGVEYDYASVMHYSRMGFSRNGQPTIVALKITKESEMMGQRRGFSIGDVKKINAMYKCTVPRFSK